MAWCQGGIGRTSGSGKVVVFVQEPEAVVVFFAISLDELERRCIGLVVGQCAVGCDVVLLIIHFRKHTIGVVFLYGTASAPICIVLLQMPLVAFLITVSTAVIDLVIVNLFFAFPINFLVG